MYPLLTHNTESSAGAAPMSQHLDETERFHRGTILLVEDNEDDRELALRAMKRTGIGHKIVAVRDGVEAMDYLKRKGIYADTTEPLPDLVLLDLKMPRMDGLQVLEQIKSDPELRTLPVVMLTSSKQDRDVQRAYNLGVNSYICKPTSFSEFLKLVNNLGNYWFDTVVLPS